MEFTCKKVEGGWVVVLYGCEDSRDLVVVKDNELFKQLRAFVEKENTLVAACTPQLLTEDNPS